MMAISYYLAVRKVTALRELQRPRNFVQLDDLNQRAVPQEVFNNDWKKTNI